jgi:hypothetical protein
VILASLTSTEIAGGHGCDIYVCKRGIEVQFVVRGLGQSLEASLDSCRMHAKPCGGSTGCMTVCCEIVMCHVSLQRALLVPDTRAPSCRLTIYTWCSSSVLQYYGLVILSLTCPERNEANCRSYDLISLLLPTTLFLSSSCPLFFFFVSPKDGAW